MRTNHAQRYTPQCLFARVGGTADSARHWSERSQVGLIGKKDIARDDRGKVLSHRKMEVIPPLLLQGWGTLRSFVMRVQAIRVRAGHPPSRVSKGRTFGKISRLRG
jgi:hypothetical protein